MACLPVRMLTDSIIIKVPNGVSVWQEPTAASNEIRLFRVHIQRSSGVRTTSINNEIQAHATVWYDCKISTPHGIDFCALKSSAEENGTAIIAEFGGVKYSVSNVVECKDGFGRPHHFEIEVV